MTGRREPRTRGSAGVTPSQVVLWLGVAIVALALVAGLSGLLWSGGAGAFTFTSVRGHAVEIYGYGLYQYDSTFYAAGYRGSDLVTVAIAVPLLIAGLLLYRRGSLRGGLVAAGMLAYLLYVYASLSLNAAFNPLLLVYVALFSLSLWALARLLPSLRFASVVGATAFRLPRRFPAVFLIVGGALTAAVWLLPTVTALLQGDVPARTDSYSTSVTTALDLAVIVPACFVAGAGILRRQSLGYVLACPLLGIIVLLGPGFVTQTLWQISAGVELTAGEAIGPIAGFGVVAVVAVWVSIALLRGLPATRPTPGAALAAGVVAPPSAAG
jgi:hypothetical protein